MAGSFILRAMFRLMIGIRTSATVLTLLLAIGVGRGADPISLQIARQDTAIHLSWSGGDAGARFTLETTSNLAASAWQPVGGTVWPALTREWSLSEPSGTAAFFRVVVQPPGVRGSVETQELLRSYTPAELQAILQQNGVPGVNPVPVQAWKVIYTTVDPHGDFTHASALVVVPVDPPKPLPLVSFQHGTVTLRDDVPSRLNFEGNLGLVLGAANYAAVLPDYLGLGDSPGFHPYHHANSEATAVVDGLRAARQLIGTLGVSLNGQVFLTGYSQGGHATLAAQREIETRHADEFTLTASAPGAGAYDLSGTTAADFLSDRVQPNPYYFVYVLKAYVEVYQWVPDIADLLRAPYDTQVPPLLDGMHDGGAINAVLPAHPAEILKAEVLDSFRNDPDDVLRAALRDNDLIHGWVPSTPTRLYHCHGDRDVLFANSQVAYDSFKAAGATSVELIDPFPLADHGTCVPFTLLGVKNWFDGLRR